VAINNVYFTTPPFGGVEKKTSAAVSEMSLTGSFVTWSVVQAGIAISFTTERWIAKPTGY
jgi:hypothetical protein